MQADPGRRTAVLIVRTWTEGDGLMRARLLTLDGSRGTPEAGSPGDLGAVVGHEHILELIAAWLVRAADDTPR
jgi:hypothetical protein